MASAVALTLGTGQAMAAGTQVFGSCDGSGGGGVCVTGNGHASVSVADTLTINEQRAISFGNVSTAAAIGATLVLGTDGSRTNAGFTPLHGGANGTAGPPDSGGQSPGHYTIEGGDDDTGSATQVYISFATTTGDPIDMCNATVCDSYHPTTVVTMTPPTGGGAGDLTVDHFTINEDGSDAYGHYINNDGNGGTGPAGITNPFLHDHTVATPGSGIADVVVGARLTSTVATLTKGKYTGTFLIMASY